MSARRGTREVAVIGGGIIGLAIARRLALDGSSVTLLERGRAGAGATSASGGMLSPLFEHDTTPGPFLDLAFTSFRMYEAFAGELAEASNMDVGFRADGKLRVALDEAEAQRLRDSFDRHKRFGFAVEWLDAAAARAREPLLGPEVRAAVFDRDDHQVEPRALAHAAAAAARAAGVDVRESSAVERVEVASGAVSGVALEGGGRVACDVAVLAAGVRSGTIGGLPRELPMVPVHGDMLALAPRALPARVVGSEDAYLIPRSSGRLVIGATVMRGDADDDPRPEAIALLLHHAVRVLPSLAGAEIVEAWAGVRPGTPDDLPIIGADPDVRGLLYATGHYRNGILLAPVTADVIAALVAEREPPVDVTPFAAERFG